MDFWKRHANPISGWSRVLTGPILFVVIWFHQWLLLLPLLIWILVNPIAFPETKNLNNWASKSVLGERLWMKNIRLDGNLGLNMLAGIFFVPALFFTFVNDFWPAVLCISLSFIFKMWFCDRMVSFFERVKETPKTMRN